MFSSISFTSRESAVIYGKVCKFILFKYLWVQFHIWDAVGNTRENIFIQRLLCRCRKSGGNVSVLREKLWANLVLWNDVKTMLMFDEKCEIKRKSLCAEGFKKEENETRITRDENSCDNSELL